MWIITDELYEIETPFRRSTIPLLPVRTVSTLRPDDFKCVQCGTLGQLGADQKCISRAGCLPKNAPVQRWTRYLFGGK